MKPECSIIVSWNELPLAVQAVADLGLRSINVPQVFSDGTPFHKDDNNARLGWLQPLNELYPGQAQGDVFARLGFYARQLRDIKN